MAEIRIARRSDIPKLVLLGEEFAVLSQPIHGFSVSRARIIEFANEVVENPDAVVLVLLCDGIIQGFLAGVKQRIYFSEDVAMQELAWYVKKGFKALGMLEAFESVAKAMGCNQIIVGNKPAYYDLQRYYERIGFKLLENQYVKHL